MLDLIVTGFCLFFLLSFISVNQSNCTCVNRSINQSNPLRISMSLEASICVSLIVFFIILHIHIDFLYSFYTLCLSSSKSLFIYFSIVNSSYAICPLCEADVNYHPTLIYIYLHTHQIRYVLTYTLTLSPKRFRRVPFLKLTILMDSKKLNGVFLSARLRVLSPLSVAEQTVVQEILGYQARSRQRFSGRLLPSPQGRLPQFKLKASTCLP